MPKIINYGTVAEWAPMVDGIGSVELLEKYMQSVVDEAKVMASERTGMLECRVSPILEFQFRELGAGVWGSPHIAPEEIRDETREERYLNGRRPSCPPRQFRVGYYNNGNKDGGEFHAIVDLG